MNKNLRRLAEPGKLPLILLVAFAAATLLYGVYTLAAIGRVILLLMIFFFLSKRRRETAQGVYRIRDLRDGERQEQHADEFSAADRGVRAGRFAHYLGATKCFSRCAARPEPGSTRT